MEKRGITLPKILGGLALTVALGAGIYNRCDDQPDGSIEPNDPNNPISDTEIPKATTETQERVKLTMTTTSESNTAINKAQLTSIFDKLWKLKAENIRNERPTSIVEFLKSQNIDMGELVKTLSQAIKQGDRQAYSFTQNLLEELLTGHGFVFDYKSRADNLVMDPSEEGGTFEGSDQDYMERQKEMTQYMEEKLGIPEEIQYANRIANAAKTAYDDLSKAKDPGELNDAMGFFTEMLSAFYEKLGECDYKEDVIIAFCNAAGISRNDMADKAKEAIAYWTLKLNTEEAARNHIYQQKLDNLRNLEAILRK